MTWILNLIIAVIVILWTVTWTIWIKWGVLEVNYTSVKVYGIVQVVVTVLYACVVDAWLLSVVGSLTE